MAVSPSHQLRVAVSPSDAGSAGTRFPCIVSASGNAGGEAVADLLLGSDDDDEDGDVWYDAEEASTPRSRADSSSQGRIDGSSNDEAPRATVDLASTALSKLSINSSPSLADLASTALSKLRINNPPPVLTLTPATPPPPGTTTTTTTASYPRRHRVDTTRLSVRESDRRLRGPNERHLAAAHDRRAVVARRRERLREALLRHGVRLPEVTGRVYVYTLGWDDWAWYGNW